jgi:hypothetical protein
LDPQPSSSIEITSGKSSKCINFWSHFYLSRVWWTWLHFYVHKRIFCPKKKNIRNKSVLAQKTIISKIDSVFLELCYILRKIWLKIEGKV